MFSNIEGQTLLRPSARVAALEKGVALVGVLWLLLLLTTIVISLSRETQLAAKTAQIYVSEVQAKAQIEGAVAESIFWLLKGSPFTVLQTTMRTRGIDVAIVDLESQLNINTGSQAQLAMVLLANEITNADELAENIIKFRDAFAESEDSSKNSFNHVLDLARVPGFSINLIRKLQKDITVLNHTVTGRVVTLMLATDFSSTRLGADVTVRFTGAVSDPYRILSWHWTTG